MKLATKFALAFLVCGVLGVLVYSSVAATREAQRTEQTVAEDLVSLGHTVSQSVLAVWERDGDARARELVGYTDRDEGVDVRWVWLDEEGDQPLAPRAGREVTGPVSHGESTSWDRVRPDGTRKVYAYVPLLRPGQRAAALELSRPLPSASSVFWTEVREQIVASTVVAAFATFFAVVLTSWIVSRPLGRVAEQARRIGAGDLSHRLPVKGSDEVSSLVGELNAMCDQLREAQKRADEESQKRISALDQLRHADRLRTVGTLASGIAHELGTPLNVMSLRAKMIASGEVALADAPASAIIIATQADRVTRIVRQLLDFARRRAPNRAEVELGEIAERALALVATLAKTTNVKLVVARANGDVKAKVDAGQIEQALTNLVINGVHASSRTVTVTTRRVRTTPPAGEADRDCAVVEVIDDGAGIAGENLERIFEPFFTTKGVGEGTGLGLSVTHGIVQDHEGWMTARSEIGKGSTFTLYLPI